MNSCILSFTLLYMVLYLFFVFVLALSGRATPIRLSFVPKDPLYGKLLSAMSTILARSPVSHSMHLYSIEAGLSVGLA